IPLSSEKQHVLACVAGTAQAREALKNAQIPQTEAVKPGAAPDAAPVFDGEPQFADIPQCSVRYAVNTPCPIFLVDRRYYWCQEGIWYDSDYAVGPWFVCSWVPGPIYLIPPSCPFYYVTFCRIFSVSARAIYVGYYPGYRGCYAWGGSVVYGTGWSYRRWSGNVCYSRPLTWGACVRYSPAVCNWTLRVGTGSSCAWAGVGYSTGWRAPTLSVGVGGSVGLYRAGHAAPAPTPVTMHKPDNLYSRQPDRILRPVAPETSRSKSFGERGAEVPRSPAARTPVPPPHHDGTRTPAPTAPSTPDHREAPRASREIPRTPAPDGEAPKAPPPDHREGPKSSREIPRAPAPDREAPKLPPVERRDPPKAPPSPPPPVERRDPPRNPPPPPPPVERRAPPPPPPPPVERRSPPPPPPPPPQRDPDRRR
ncbi:MAG: hypothetical protein HY293_09805, partial [Planctomycetes bacterium]|nr:hypothetical protein [Planctomycetota bacterium]